MTNTLKPILKCLGGKTKLIPVLKENFPPDLIKNPKGWTYVEPFLEGGALLLHMLEHYPQLKAIYANELNFFTFSVWSHLSSPAYIAVLKATLEEYSKLPFTKENFASIKQEFNSRASTGTEILDSPQQTARFMYLNKTCFNGLSRFNKKGEFNAPIGSYINPTIYDPILFDALTSALSVGKIYITNGDFQGFIEAYIKSFNSKTLVYFDPPYIPLSLTANFTTYTPGGFSLYDHKRLRLVMDLLTSKKVKVMASNSSSPLTYEIFKDYNIVEIEGKRSVSAKTAGRKSVKELLIKNY